jgi:histidinol dehydrogenase
MLYLDYPAKAKAVKKRLLAPFEKQPEVERSVERIVSQVQKKGDKAVFEFTRKFDRVALSAKNVSVSPSEMKMAWKSLDPYLRSVIELAAQRIRDFHSRQIKKGYATKDKTGSRLEYRILPLSSVGIYVPGGTAAYPSSVLMNAIPAQIAGVEEIVMVTPPGKDGKVNPAILGTAFFLGLKKVYRIGGAQAVAALAFGTQTIPRVDKIVGPGNAYVAAAKKLLFGVIDIDMIAGPSEILVIADNSTPLSYIVADLLSLAEHDPMAVAMLIYIGKLDIPKFKQELELQVKNSPRRKIIEQSLKAQGAVITVKTPEQAVELANLKAPEHLEIMVKKPGDMIKRLRNAGAIFVGSYSPEPLGDYVAGPNHVLPTGGTARFFSPLSVSDFTKATSILQFSRKGFGRLAQPAITFAEEEGLWAHAQAVKVRLES